MGNNDDTVSVVNTVSATKIGSIPLPWDGDAVKSDADLALSPDGGTLYASIKAFPDAATYVVDTASRTVRATLPEGGAVAVSADGTRAYIADLPSHTLYAVDARTDSIVGQVAVGDDLNAVAVTPDGKKIHIAQWGRLCVVDAATMTVTGELDRGTDYLAELTTTPDGRRLYAATNIDDTVLEVDTTRDGVVRTVPVAELLSNLAMTQDGTRLYVATQRTDQLVTVDTATNEVVDIG